MNKSLSPLAPPSYAATNAVFIRRSLTLSLRNTESLMMSIILPVMLMLLFTYVCGGAIAPGGDYANYVVPGIILLCAGYGAATTAVDVSTDMANGIIDRIRTMPIRSLFVVTGHVAASLARNLVASGVVIAVALLVGFRPNGSFVEWLAALGVIVLFILTLTWLYAAIGLVAGSPSAASGYGFILLFLPYLSSAFVPIDTMPHWLRGVASHQPITPLIETIRGLLLGTPIGDHAWIGAAWCAGLIAIALVWCGFAFKKRAGRR
ncbi:ABC transporter permease [Cohnella sp. GbtcB17]|uniref:ABC transporter permease n=1 Tax=Cohnella sp. GbtcB17 TaxID=2824762 RepID=UPI001C2FF557